MWWYRPHRAFQLQRLECGRALLSLLCRCTIIGTKIWASYSGKQDCFEQKQSRVGILPDQAAHCSTDSAGQLIDLGLLHPCRATNPTSKSMQPEVNSSWTWEETRGAYAMQLLIAARVCHIHTPRVRQAGASRIGSAHEAFAI